MTEHPAIEVRSRFAQEVMTGMDFLNEAPERYPEAISLASGRPDLALHSAAMPWLGAAVRESVEGFTPTRCNYGATRGTVAEQLSRWVEIRSEVSLPPASICVTTGAQEAMFLSLAALCKGGADVVMAPDPTYLGILGAAVTLGVRTVPLQPASELDGESLRRSIGYVRQSGLVPRALYLIPDHDNPSGFTIPEEARADILRVAGEEGVVVLEDVAYRELSHDASAARSLLADGSSAVVQIGTFAKTLLPGLRLGYLAANACATEQGVMTALSNAKTFTTVNTSTIAQAAFANVFESYLESWLGALPALGAIYKRKRDVLVSCLESTDLRSNGVRWSVPNGGFFLPLTLPFQFGTADLQACAEQFGVVCSPMRYFSQTERQNSSLRLSFSTATEADLLEASRRLAAYVSARRRPSA